MLRPLLLLTLLASPAFAESGVVIDFQRVLKECNYGYRAREAAEARTKDKSPAEKRKAEQEEYEKVYALAFPMLQALAKEAKVDFVFLEERGVVFEDLVSTSYVTKDLIDALNQHSRNGAGSLKASLARDSGPLRVAVVNLEAVFERSKAKQVAKAKMEAQFKAAQAELDQLQAEAKALMAKVEAQKKGTAEYEAANSAAVDKMRSVMMRKQMREYELDFFQKKAIEDVFEAVRKATRTVAQARGFNLVLDAEDARVAARAPAIDLSADVLAAVDAPEVEVKKTPPPKPTAIATVGVRALWGQLQKTKPKSEPGTEIPARAGRLAETAKLELIVDDEVLVYANPEKSRTRELGASFSAE